jgi:hypothetical protein
MTTPPELIVEQRAGYLYVEYAGDPLTLEMVVTTINKVASTLRACGLKAVLIVRNAPLLKDDESRTLVASLISRLVPEDVRFAIVDKYGNDPEEVRHAAAASREAGWNLHAFDTTEEAISWLAS